jgi:hypothetical protein
MGDDINSVGILVRREIEALLAVPLIGGFMEEFGREKALDIARKVIRDLALESGKLLATFSGGNKMENLAEDEQRAWSSPIFVSLVPAP